MKRTLIAFVVVYLALGVISVRTGSEFVLLQYLTSLTIHLALNALVVIPIYSIFGSRHWLQWWHLVFGGLLISLIVLLVTNAWTDEVYGLTNILWRVMTYTMASYVFWFIGIWRNIRFPYVSSAIPLASLAFISVWIPALALNFWLFPSFIHGHVTEYTNVGERGLGTALVRLEDGQIVTAPMIHTYVNLPEPGNCANIFTRRTYTFASGHRYWLSRAYKCVSKDSNNQSPYLPY